MAHRTLTRQDLLQIAYVAGPPGLTHNEARSIVEATLDAVSAALVNGESVKLRGFGTFNVRHKTPRIGRNPKTGEEYPISARRVLTFKPSPRLVAAINGEVPPPDDMSEEEDAGSAPPRGVAARTRSPSDSFLTGR